MILSIPVKRVEIRRADGQRVETYELVPGFVRVTSENPADNDAQNGGHILISNPLIEWAFDQVNRTNLGSGERIYIHLHTTPASNPPDGTGIYTSNSQVDVSENDSFV